MVSNLNGINALQVTTNRKRRSSRQKRTSFNSLVVPNVAWDCGCKEDKGQLSNTISKTWESHTFKDPVHRKRRSSRQKRSSFNSLVVPNVACDCGYEEDKGQLSSTNSKTWECHTLKDPVNRKRRSSRRKRTSFFSLILRSVSSTCEFKKDFVTRERSHHRRKRTVFSNLVITKTLLEEKHVQSRLYNTAWRKKNRHQQTEEQRQRIRAVENARKKRKRETQTREERDRNRSLNNACHKRARQQRTDQQNLLGTANTDRQTIASHMRNLSKKAIARAMRNGPRRMKHSAKVTRTGNHNKNHETSEASVQGTRVRCKSFFESVQQLRWSTCSQCNASFFPDKSLDICGICSKEMKRGIFPLKFSGDNYMNPGFVPNVLKRLTELEHILIAKIHPMMSVYRINGQQYRYSGNVINFAQDVNSIATVLPFRPADLSAILIVNRVGANATKEFRVRREYVRQALVWLKKNHIFYRDIEIDESSLESLPEDDIPKDIPNISFHDDNHTTSRDFHENSSTKKGIDGERIDEEDVHIDDFLSAGTLEQCPQKNQKASIRKVLHLPDVDRTIVNMPVSNIVIDEFSTPGYITMVFPVLFPFGLSDLRQARPRKLSPSEYFQYLMKYSDKRFAKDNRFRYFAWNSISRWRALSLGDVYVKKNPKDAQLTIQDIQSMVSSGDRRLASCVSYYSKSIRGTRAYWFSRMKELTAMVKQLGAPTIFFTLSAADLQWPELFDVLDPSANDTHLSILDRIKKRATLVNENPSVVAWFFQKRVELFFKFFLKEEFSVIDHWYRFEWQHRGSGHVHGFLWLHDAPSVDFLTNDEVKERVIKYFDRLVSCENPDTTGSITSQMHPCARILPDDFEFESDDADYASLINWVMRHTKCGSYCLRRQKKTNQEICRFRYPFDIIDRSCIIEEPLNSKMFRFLAHRNDSLVCSHNRKVLQTWRANIDWSAVLSVESVIHYIAKYATKAEPSSQSFTETLKQIVDDIRRSCHTSKSAIKRLLMKTISERDISAQEVCHLLMGYPLTKTSRKFMLLNLREDSMLSTTICRNCDSHDDETLRTEPSFLLHYMDRPLEYEDVSLLHMAKNYYFSKNSWHKSKREIIVRVLPEIESNTVVDNVEAYELYCQQQVLLHHHYRNLQEAKGDSDTWTSQYVALGLSKIQTDSQNQIIDDEFEEEELDTNMEFHHQFREEWMIAASMGPKFDMLEDVELGLRDIDIAHDWSVGLHKYPDMDLEKKFIHNLLGVVENTDIELLNNGPSVQLTNLSSEQRKAHDFVLNSLQNKEHFHMIISGGAGTGKSTLINAIVGSATNLFKSTKAIRVMAPTGVAAFNIGGTTIHHELSISAERKPSQPYVSIVGNKCMHLQENLKDTKLIIIDEYSMLGRAMLANVDYRCRDIFANDRVFGGVSVILVGDMRQLPPVFDSPLYCTGGNCMHQCGTIAYSTFTKSVRLSFIFRQTGEDQASFREALNRLSDGTSTIDDWYMFKSRDYSILSLEEINTFKYALRLFPTKQAANNYNRERLISLGNPIARIISKNNCDVANKAEGDQARGLEKVICISVGARVMLRANLATHYGLVNGAMGTVVEIVYAINCKSPVDQPVAILVDFDNYHGPVFREGTNTLPIPPITSNWKATDGASCQRTQFPIVLCWAITVHKSQGLTLDKAVIDIGEKESLGLTFVALSRTRKLQDLAFSPMFTYERLQKIGKCNGLKGRLQEEQRLCSISI